MATIKIYIRSFIIILLSLISFGCGKGSLTKKHPSYFYTDSQLVQLCEAISDNDENKIDKLLAKGIDINTVGKDGMTPLLWALSMDDIKVFEMVLKKGGNPNIRYNQKTGDSVMTLVTKMKNTDYLKLALNYGGNPNYQNSNYKTLIYTAIIYSPSLEKVKMLVTSGADIDHQNLMDDTPVMDAAFANQLHIVYYLLKMGANPNISNNADNTIVDCLKSRYHRIEKTGERYQQLINSVELLRKKGIKVDLKTKSKMKMKSYPKDWLEKRKAEAAKKTFKHNGSKPTIYNPVIPR